jgi:hypothetical protein
MEAQGYKFARIFYQHAPALAWRQQEVLEVETASPPEIGPPEVSTARRSRPHQSNRGERRRVRGEKNHARLRNGGEDPSWSSDEGSDSDWSSSSSGEEDRPRGRRSRRRCSQSPPRRKASQKPPEVVRQKIGEHDKSLGNPKLIHGMAINSAELTASLSPRDLSLKDGDKLFELGVDVLGLPGMYQVKMNDRVAEAERTVMATTGLIQAAIGRRTRDPIDTMWQSSQRPGLSRVKSPEDLEELIEAIEEVREASFEQQDDQIYTFLSARHYSTKEITRYQDRGGLPLITRATYRYYLALLNQIRQRYHSAPKGTSWKQTQGYGIWDFYNSKLLTLRGTSTSKRHFLLRVYVYLREAHEKKFYESSMAKYLWNYVTALQGDQKGGGAGGAAAAERCSHCRHKALHVLLKKEHQKAHCPFKDVSQQLARKAAPKGHALLTANPNLSVTDMIAQAKAAAEEA